MTSHRKKSYLMSGEVSSGMEDGSLMWIQQDAFGLNAISVGNAAQRRNHGEISGALTIPTNTRHAKISMVTTTCIHSIAYTTQLLLSALKALFNMWTQRKTTQSA